MFFGNVDHKFGTKLLREKKKKNRNKANTERNKTRRHELVSYSQSFVVVFICLFTLADFPSNLAFMPRFTIRQSFAVQAN